MPCQVVVLCGGSGTRLGNLTSNTPKPLLDIGGKTFLDFLLKEICRFGFSNVLLLAGYQGQKVYDRFHNKHILGVQINVQICEHQNGTGGDLLDNLNKLDDEFLVLNGDSWVDTNYLNFYQFAARQKSAGMFESSILLKLDHEYQRYGLVEVENLKVTAFLEKTDLRRKSNASLINAGIYYFSKKLLYDFERNTDKVSLERDILPYLVDRQELGYKVLTEETFFIDIGIPETYGYARSFLKTHAVRPAIFFDRDNTLVFDSGYNHNSRNIQWVPGARQLIKILNDSGCLVFIVTNQGGVAKGLYKRDAVVDFHDVMQKNLQSLGAHIDEFKYCPHHPDITIAGKKIDCYRRKPNSGMLAEIINDWSINLEKSFIVGDNKTDMQAGANIRLDGLLINNSKQNLQEEVLKRCEDLNVFE